MSFRTIYNVVIDIIMKHIMYPSFKRFLCCTLRLTMFKHIHMNKLYKCKIAGCWTIICIMYYLFALLLREHESIYTIQ
jgi:hypothetical protein